MPVSLRNDRRSTATDTGGLGLGIARSAVLFFFLFCGLLAAPLASAQTGPGGVGNASGTAGQPENVLWLEGGAEISTSGPLVQSWADQSGNGNDVSSGGGGSSPETEPLQGINAVSFDGTNGDFLERTGGTFLDGAGAVTMIAVVEADATGQDVAFLDSDVD